MPYSVTTPDGFTVRDIPDSVDPNSQELRDEITRLRNRSKERSNVALTLPPREFSRKRKSSGILDIPENILKGLGSGVTGMLESSALGAATLLEEESELKARKKIKDIFDIKALEGADEDSIAYKLSSGIGSIAALAPTALLGGAALPAAGVIAAGAGAGEASERARAYGATEAERNIAALKGTAIGLTEIAPLGRLAKGVSRGANKAFDMPRIDAGVDKILDLLGPKAVTNINSRIRNVAGTGLVEGAQEGAAAILQNLTEQGYNPEQVLVDTGVLEEAAIGGGAGAILQSLADAIGGRRGVRAGTGIVDDPAETTDPTLSAAQPEELVEAPVEALEEVTKEDVEEVTAADVDAVAGETEEVTEADAEMAAATSQYQEQQEKIESLQNNVDEVGFSLNIAEEIKTRIGEGATFDTAFNEVESEVGMRVDLFYGDQERLDATKNEGRLDGETVLSDTRGGGDSVPATNTEKGEASAVPVSVENPVKVNAGGVDEFGQSSASLVGGAEPNAAALAAKAAADAKAAAVAKQKEQINNNAKFVEQVLVRGGKKVKVATDEVAADTSDKEFTAPERKRLNNTTPLQQRRSDIQQRGRDLGVPAFRKVTSLVKALQDGRGIKLNKEEPRKYSGTKYNPEKAYELIEQEINTAQGNLSAVEAIKPAEEGTAPEAKFTGLPTDVPKLNKEFTDKLDLEERFINVFQSFKEDSKGETNQQIATFLRNGYEASGKPVPVGTQEYINQFAGKATVETLPPTAPTGNEGRAIRDRALLEKAGVAMNTGQDASQAARITEEAAKRAAERSNAKRKKALEDVEDINTGAGVQVVVEEIEAGIANGETELQVIDRLIANLKGKQKVSFDKALGAKDKPIPKPTDEETSALTGKGLSESDDDISGTSFEDNDQVIDTLGGISQLPQNFVNEIDGVAPPNVKTLLNKGDLSGALRALSAVSEDRRVKQIARVLSEAVGATKVKITEGDSYLATNGTVYINEAANVHTILHESAHAVVDITLNNASHPMTKQLTTLYNGLKGDLDTAYGSKNLKEFVAETLSNSEFQQKLAGMHPDGSANNALDRFFRSISNFIRRLIGMETKPLGSALEAADQAIISILSTSPATIGAGSTYKMSTRDGVQKVLRELGDVQKSFAPPTKKFREDFGKEGATTMDMITNVVSNRGALRILDTQALGDIAKAKGFGVLGDDLHKAIQRTRGKMDQSDKLMTERVKKAAKWTTGNPEKAKILDELIYGRDYGATIYQVDPTIGTTADPTAAREKYGSNSDEFAVWKEQRKSWDALGESGQNQYKYIRDTYKIQYERLKKVLTTRMQEVLGEDAAAKLQSSVFDKLFDKTALDVYFPLVREGNFKVSYTPARAAGQDIIREDRDNYVVEMYETRAEQEKAVADAKKAGHINVEFSDGDLTAANFRKNAPDTGFVKDILNALDKKDVSSEIQDEVMNLFINSLPETSFAKSFKNRTGQAGYKKDALYSMRAKVFDLSRQVERIKSTKEINDIEAQIAEKAIDLDRNNPNSTTIKNIAAELKERGKFAKNGAENKTLEGYVKTANQIAFIYTIGFNASSALVNTSQIPLFVGPMLGAEFGHIKAGKAIIDASSMVASSGNSIDSYFDTTMNEDVGSENFGEVTYELKKGLPDDIVKKYKPLTALVKRASERSYLTQSYLADAMGLDESTTSFESVREKLGMESSGRINRGNKLEKGLNSVSAVSAIMFNAGERFNRQVTLLASYNLSLETIQAREAKKDKDDRLTEEQIEIEASDDALYKSMEYNGGAVLETGSRISSMGLGRVAFMYKNYGIRMYTTMFKTGERALSLSFAPKKGETATQKEERIRQRKIAWAQVRATHLSALLIAGIQGMPLYGAVALAMDLYLGDDEDDADTVVRKYFGEGWYKGPLVDALGVDFASRVRLNSLIFEANRYHTDASIEEHIGHHLGGPAFSTGKRFFRAGEDFANGEIERGIESALPAGLTNVLRNSPIGRFQKDEGMQTRRGDVIYDDLTAGDFFAGMVGFPPSGYTFAQEQTNIEQRINKKVTKERSKLLKKFYMAMRQGNYPEATQVKRDMAKFGKKHPSARISYESLLRSFKGHQRTTAKMHNGTTLSPLMKRTLEEQRSEYDDSGFFK